MINRSCRLCLVIADPVLYVHKEPLLLRLLLVHFGHEVHHYVRGRSALSSYNCIWLSFSHEPLSIFSSSEVVALHHTHEVSVLHLLLLATSGGFLRHGFIACFAWIPLHLFRDPRGKVSLRELGDPSLRQKKTKTVFSIHFHFLKNCFSSFSILVSLSPHSTARASTERDESHDTALAQLSLSKHVAW